MQSIDQSAGDAELAKMIGARAIRKEFYTFNLNFDSNIAAAGGTLTRAAQIDAAGALAVGRFNATFWIVAVLNAAVAGTPLPIAPDPASASNTMPNLGMLTAQMSSNSWEMQNQPTRLTNLMGNSQFPNWFPVYPLIPANDTLSVTIVNNAAVAVQGQISFVGYRVRPA